MNLTSASSWMSLKRYAYYSVWKLYFLSLILFTIIIERNVYRAKCSRNDAHTFNNCSLAALALGKGGGM